MVEFTFRYRLKLASRSSISGATPRVDLLQIGDTQKVELASTRRVPITESRDLVLRAAGWPSEVQAQAEGRAYWDRFAIALVRHRIGVYPVDVAPQGTFTRLGLSMLEQKPGERVLNDHYGLTAFESQPPPRFAAMAATVILRVDAASLRETFAALCAREVTPSDRERLAIDLFNVSFLEPSANTRLLTLVMAVESLLQLQSRSAPTVDLVNSFLDEVSRSATLSPSERDSLSGSLGNLQRQSISAAGREIATKRLSDRRYMGLSPARFFTKCYKVRSQLVHGHDPRPSYSEVGRLAADLEVFVCDLLTQPFLGAPAA